MSKLEQYLRNVKDGTTLPFLATPSTRRHFAIVRAHVQNAVRGTRQPVSLEEALAQAKEFRETPTRS